MRNRFDEQLEQLNVGLIKMGALCEESIACAVKALFDEKTSEMITKVNDNEEETDHMEHDIEALLHEAAASSAAGGEGSEVRFLGA